MHMKDLMGLSEYAKHRKTRGLPGGTTQSVLNAVNAGRIPTVTVGKSKMVNPKAADHAWSINTDWSRYSPEQIAAMEAPPQPPPATTTPENVQAIQAEAWSLVFANTPVAAASLVEDLGIEPLVALRVATRAVVTVINCLGEVMENRPYLDGPVPPWAVPAVEGDLSNPDLTEALEHVAAIAADLMGLSEYAKYRPDASP